MRLRFLVLRLNVWMFWRLVFVSGGQRNWVQVFCNGGVPTELALLFMIEVKMNDDKINRAVCFLLVYGYKWRLCCRWVQVRSPSISVNSTRPPGCVSLCWAPSPAAPGTPGRRRWGLSSANHSPDSSPPGRRSRQVRSKSTLGEITRKKSTFSHFCLNWIAK